MTVAAPANTIPAIIQYKASTGFWSKPQIQYVTNQAIANLLEAREGHELQFYTVSEDFADQWLQEDLDDWEVAPGSLVIFP